MTLTLRSPMRCLGLERARLVAEDALDQLTKAVEDHKKAVRLVSQQLEVEEQKSASCWASRSDLELTNGFVGPLSWSRFGCRA